MPQTLVTFSVELVLKKGLNVTRDVRRRREFPFEGVDEGDAQLSELSVLERERRLNGVVLQDIGGLLQYFTRSVNEGVAPKGSAGGAVSFNVDSIQQVTPYLINKLMGGVVTSEELAAAEAAAVESEITVVPKKKEGKKASKEADKKKRGETASEDQLHISESSRSLSPIAAPAASPKVSSLQQPFAQSSGPEPRLGHPPIPESFILQALQLSSSVAFTYTGRFFDHISPSSILSLSDFPSPNATSFLGPSFLLALGGVETKASVAKRATQVSLLLFVI
jgi:hypothetical protein